MNHYEKENLRRQLITAQLKLNPNSKILNVSNECGRTDIYSDGKLVEIKYNWFKIPIGKPTETMQ